MPGAVSIAVGFCIYATVGGVLIQGPLLLVRRLDDAVAAARTVNLAQGAGLAVGGLVCCGVARWGRPWRSVVVKPS